MRCESMFSVSGGGAGLGKGLGIVRVYIVWARRSGVDTKRCRFLAMVI